MTKITAIIPTFNEESNIQRALDSVDFADEIIVIDSFSTDKTIEIVKNSNAILLQREFDNFSNQKNFAIAKASNDWIFLLDSDETTTDALKEEVKQVVASDTRFSAFYTYRNFFFKGKKLNHSGWRRDRAIRLFRKESCEYQGKVHEEIVTTGEVGFLEKKLNHYSYTNYKKYRNKLRGYAKLQAEELLEKGQFVTPYHLFIKPLVRFFIQFLIQFGFLDGYRGFVISKVHAYGVWRRYVEVLKLKYSSKKEAVNPIENFDINLNEKDVSIVIVNYKSWKHLDNCLEALATVDEDHFTFEVVVVDNASNDGKLEEFTQKYPQFRFVENSGNNGFANGCNTGALNALGSNLFFLNPDTIATKEAIQELLAYMNSTDDVGIVSCNQKNNNGSYEDADRIFPDLFSLFGFTRIFYRLFHKTKENNTVVFPDWVSGSVVFINRKWFQKIKGWNEDYWMYFEDVDLSKKVRDLDGEVVLLKDTNIIHNHGGASRINVKTASITKTEVLISKHVYIKNHFKGFKQFLLLFLVIINNLVMKAIAAVFGICFFFIPKMKLKIYLFTEMIKYYYHALKKGTWLSKRSNNLDY